MKTIKINTRLTVDEKETILSYNAASKMWEMYSLVSKHYNKALKQGWKPVVKYVNEDGCIAGYILTAPSRAITIRSVEPKKMSKKQLSNLDSTE